MNERYIQILGLTAMTLYGAFVVFLYAAEPRSLDEITIKAKNTLEDAVTRGQVATGTYQVDEANLNAGISAFRQDNFVAARDFFQKADPEKRDGKTQFYVAYSFYRQGWGRVSNDDALFKQALEAVDRVALLDRDYRSNDSNLQLRTARELKAEIEEGMQVTADDFNPLRLARERK